MNNHYSILIIDEFCYNFQIIYKNNMFFYMYFNKLHIKLFYFNKCLITYEFH